MKPGFACFLALFFASAIASAASEKFTASREGKQVIVRLGKSEILRYQAEPGEFPRPGIKELFRRGGYIQSIHSPAGKRLTEDFPIGHVHHHGVWSPWTKTEFEGRHPDFWNMGDGTGRVEFVALDDVWEKDGKVGFRTRHQFVDMTVKPEKIALLETWEVTVSGDLMHYVIDLTLTQTCTGNSPLKLPEYRYGGFGFRGNAQWDGANNAKFLTPSGKTDRTQINTAREAWCWIGGKVDAEMCGVTIFCHPENFRAPQPIRMHPTEPFFCYAPQQLGEMQIEPGKPYVARYRIIATDDQPNAQMLQKWAHMYAEAP